MRLVYQVGSEGVVELARAPRFSKVNRLACVAQGSSHASMKLVNGAQQTPRSPPCACAADACARSLLAVSWWCMYRVSRSWFVQPTSLKDFRIIPQQREQSSQGTLAQLQANAAQGPGCILIFDG